MPRARHRQQTFRGHPHVHDRLQRTNAIQHVCPGSPDSFRPVVEQGKRLIVPDTALMCADVEEAKDVVDAILARLSSG